MNRWDLIAGVTALVSRVPVERLFTRDHTKGLDEFEERLEEKSLLASTTKSPQHNSEQGLRAKGLLNPTGARVTNLIPRRKPRQKRI